MKIINKTITEIICKNANYVQHQMHHDVTPLPAANVLVVSADCSFVALSCYVSYSCNNICYISCYSGCNAVRCCCCCC